MEPGKPCSPMCCCGVMQDGVKEASTWQGFCRGLHPSSPALGSLCHCVDER